MTRKRTNYQTSNGWCFRGHECLPRHVTVAYHGDFIEIRVGPRERVKRAYLDIRDFQTKAQLLDAANSQLRALKQELNEEGYEIHESNKKTECSYIKRLGP